MTIKNKIVTTLLLSSVALSASGAGKLAFVNPAIIIEKSPQSQSAANLLKQEFEQRESDLVAMAKKIQALEEKYQTDGAIMSADQKKIAEDEIVQSKRQFQFNQDTLQEDLKSRRRVLLQEIQRSISDVIQAYGKKQGYDFIFTEGVVYVDDAVNITDDLLKELSK